MGYSETVGTTFDAAIFLRVSAGHYRSACYQLTYLGTFVAPIQQRPSVSPHFLSNVSSISMTPIQRLSVSSSPHPLFSVSQHLRRRVSLSLRVSAAVSHLFLDVPPQCLTCSSMSRRSVSPVPRCPAAVSHPFLDVPPQCLTCSSMSRRSVSPVPRCPAAVSHLFLDVPPQCLTCSSMSRRSVSPVPRCPAAVWPVRPPASCSARSELQWRRRPRPTARPAPPAPGPETAVR